MTNMFSRSWEITKLSFDVMKKDKELLLFPLFSIIFSMLFIAALLFPTVITFLIGGGTAGTMQGLYYVLIFITYLGLAFIATFFNVCVVYTAKKRFEGGNSRFGEALKFAFSKIHLIFMWSLLSATVGLILRILDNMANKSKGIGRVLLKILVSVLGMGWSIITIFVVPAMVYNNLSPFAAIKKSVQTLKKTWGESLIRHLGLGLIQGIFILLGLVAIVLSVFLMIKVNVAIGALILIIAIIYIIVVALIFTVANSIFNTALYEYAEKGKIPAGYNKEVMQGAFKEQKKNFLGRGIV